MNDQLLEYYNRELGYFRRLAGEYAERHPKIAGRLRLGPESSEDPHVERLIEAVALLTSRIRLKLDDEFPEIVDGMLDVLYPHFQRPVPSMAIVRFDVDATTGDGVEGYDIPAGSEIDTEPVDGEPIRFRTCYDTRLFPITVKDATCAARPFGAPTTPRSSEATAVLRIRLACPAGDVRFGDVALDRLRFFLNGMPQYVYRLYDALQTDVLDIAIATGPDDSEPVVLPKSAIRPVGFDPNEGMLPYSPASRLGYRLLTEYFAFPEKFLFLEIGGFDAIDLDRFDGDLDVYLYLRRSSLEIEQNVDRTTFQLGCTPIVNLMSHRAEPVPLTETATDFHVVPDVRRPRALEIYTIDRVTATSPEGDEVPCLPFYSTRHHEGRSADAIHWVARRRPAESSADVVDEGIEIDVTVVDIDGEGVARHGWYLDVETTCTNRDLAARVPIGGAQPRMTIVAGSGIVKDVRLLTAPTRTLRPTSGKSTAWKLVSHLSLGHLSLTGGEDGARALREMLMLYDVRNSAETRAIIGSLRSVSNNRVAGRVPGDRGGGICQGVEVTIDFDPRPFPNGGLVLFASVIERFLSLHCSINSFTRLVARTGDGEDSILRWPPRSGGRILV